MYVLLEGGTRVNEQAQSTARKLPHLDFFKLKFSFNFLSTVNTNLNLDLI